MQNGPFILLPAEWLFSRDKQAFYHSEINIHYLVPQILFFLPDPVFFRVHVYPFKKARWIQRCRKKALTCSTQIFNLVLYLSEGSSQHSTSSYEALVPPLTFSCYVLQFLTSYLKSEDCYRLYRLLSLSDSHTYFFLKAILRSNISVSHFGYYLYLSQGYLSKEIGTNSNQLIRVKETGPRCNSGRTLWNESLSLTVFPQGDLHFHEYPVSLLFSPSGSQSLHGAFCSHFPQ